MKFLDRQNDMVLGAIEDDIKETLYESWVASHADEGAEYLEWQVMSYASEELQAQYNAFYEYTPSDPFYLGVLL